jgi:hypothetical protein
MPTMSYGASLRADTRRTSICRLRWAPCWRVALRHSDVLAMACWMGPTRSRTVDYLPRQRFPSREASSFGEAFTAFVFGHAHIHSSIDVPTGSGGCPEFCGTSVAAPSASGCAHLIIVHDGYDRFGSLALESYSQCRQVQVTVDAAELLAGLRHRHRRKVRAIRGGASVRY